MIDSNVNGSQSKFYTNETQAKPNAEKTNSVKENKQEEKENKTSNLSKPDEAGVENYKESKHEAKIVCFDNDDSGNVENSNEPTKTETSHEPVAYNDNTEESEKTEDYQPMAQAGKISDKDMDAIMSFVAKIKDQTMEAVLKSFDLMLIHARKMMEENQKYIKEKVIPKEEAIKAEALRKGEQPPFITI